MKILLLFNNNLFNKITGTQQRLNALLEYFKSKNIKVHLFVAGRENREFEVKDLKFDYSLIQKLHIGYKKYYKSTLLCKIKDEINRPFRKKREKKGLFCKFTINKFQQILRNKYDYIVYTRSFNNKFAEICKEEKVKQICLVEDIFSINQYQNNKEFALGKAFEEEFKFFEKMNKLIFISQNEKLFFDSVLDTENHLIPHFLSSKTMSPNKKIYDICYVASNNHHNTKSIKWWLKNVYPKLDKKLKIIFVGKICERIKEKENYKNIEFINFVENLDAIYSKSKVAICPMLTGTGLKIKIVEALSFGLPIVCTNKGAVGFDNKGSCLIENDAINFAKTIQKLIKDKKLYNKQSKLSLKVFNDNFSKEKIYKKLNKIF